MKKIILSICFLFCIQLLLKAQENKLILVHPTEYNLKLFSYLVDQKVIEIDNLQVTGVYYSKETYNYQKSVNYIINNDLAYIQLQEINDVITPENLYQQNNCSPVFKEIFENSKGILFFGGPDLPPSIYGEPMNLLTEVTDPYRHYFEASFLFHLLGGSQNNEFVPLLDSNPDYVVYGICLGMQTMNIAAGGTMIQDIPTEIYGLKTAEEVLQADNNMQHKNYNNNLTIDTTFFAGNFHEISISDFGPITGNYNSGQNPLVYSNHHQAVEKLGKNLTVIATSVDGKIIEAITHTKYKNVLGIQFHPEGTYLYNSEIKYRKSNQDTLSSGKEILQTHRSLEFHIELWKTFNKKLNDVKY